MDTCLYGLGRFRRGWMADHTLLGEETYELCWAPSDCLRGAACFGHRSWLQSAQTNVVRVKYPAETSGRWREHHYARVRRILRSAVRQAAQAWNVAAK